MRFLSGGKLAQFYGRLDLQPVALTQSAHPLAWSDLDCTCLYKEQLCFARLRQNKETHLDIGQDDIVNTIEFRIARYTFMPGYNGEPLHVMYTTPGHGYGVLLNTTPLHCLQLDVFIATMM